MAPLCGKRKKWEGTGGETTQVGPALQDPTRVEVLVAELARREQKAASLGRVVEEQCDSIKNFNVEVASSWMAKAATTEVMQEVTRKEKECVQMLLNGRS